MTRVLDYEKPSQQRGVAQVRVDDEKDRVVVHANGIVVDVIANADGSVYVEAYAYESAPVMGTRRQVVVQHAAIDRYTVRNPNLRLDLAEVTA